YLVEKSDKYIGNPDYRNAVANRITSPASAVQLSNTTTVKVMVTNEGALILNTADLYLYVNDSLYAVENTNLNLLPGDSMEYTFNLSPDLSVNQNYDIMVMVDAADDAASDDVTSISLFNNIGLEFQNTENLEVYPNPGPGVFRIRSTGFSGEVQLILLDISGKPVQRETVKGEELNATYKLETKVTPGVYTLELVSDLTRQRVKLIVQ
ncbi:MAG: T9SS type A sorting domain-containing protein, partial [Owenweeksia sp.]